MYQQTVGQGHRERDMEMDSDGLERVPGTRRYEGCIVSRTTKDKNLGISMLFTCVQGN